MENKRTLVDRVSMKFRRKIPVNVKRSMTSDTPGLVSGRRQRGYLVESLD